MQQIFKSSSLSGILKEIFANFDHVTSISNEPTLMFYIPFTCKIFNGINTLVPRSCTPGPDPALPAF